jgi:hypothetical protein
MLCLDNYRHLSLFLDVRTFLNLTTCSKNLRKLYRENIIWESFLRRDFSKYLLHPSYTLERYIKCKKRTYLDCLENETVEKDTPYDNYISATFNYIDKNEQLMKIIPCKEWGLIYNGRPVISQRGLLIAIMLIPHFSDLKYNALDLIQSINENAEILDETDIKKYFTKSLDLVYKVCINDKFKSSWKMGTTVEEFKKDPLHQDIKNIWLELGFN